MLKNLGFLILLYFGCTEAIAQKIIEKQFDSYETEHVIITSEIINKLTIVSEKTNHITISTKISGENGENVVVTTFKENKTLNIGTGFTPYFEAENDKLAAHKVISVEMEITIPEYLKVEVDTAIASVSVHGNYEDLRANLVSGNCDMNNFFGNATIKTVIGSIVVYAEALVSGRAFSARGSVINNLPVLGKYTIIAESRDGDISLYQTK